MTEPQGQETLSVIITARDEEKYLPDCLRSLLSQDATAGQVQVVVSANACTDADCVCRPSPRPGFCGPRMAPRRHRSRGRRKIWGAQCRQCRRRRHIGGCISMPTSCVTPTCWVNCGQRSGGPGPSTRPGASATTATVLGLATLRAILDAFALFRRRHGRRRAVRR